MKKEDFWGCLSGCGCYLLPVAAIGLLIFFSEMRSKSLEPIEAAKRSRDSIARIRYEDSIANVLLEKDNLTTVIVVEEDRTYHYYTDCPRIFLGGDMYGELVLRSLAKEEGYTVCPDCRSIYLENDSNPEPEAYDFFRELKENHK